MRAIRVAGMLVTAAALLAGCQSAATVKPVPPVSSAPPVNPVQAPLSVLRLAWVHNRWDNRGGKPRPLYAAVEADHPALSRLAALLASVRWADDPQVREFPIARPGGDTTLYAVRRDGTQMRVARAYRCTGDPHDPSKCQPLDNWVIIDGRPAQAPDLAQYLFADGYKPDMPPVVEITLVQPTPPSSGYAHVRPGEIIAVQGEGVLEDPLAVILVDSDAVGRPRRADVTLATVPAPTGAWSWRGAIPANVPPGRYALCPGQNGGCQVNIEVDPAP